MRKQRIPDEVFILTYLAPDNRYTPIDAKPFYSRQEAELAASRYGRGPGGRQVEVVGYHIIKTVELG